MATDETRETYTLMRSGHRGDTYQYRMVEAISATPDAIGRYAQVWLERRMGDDATWTPVYNVPNDPASGRREFFGRWEVERYLGTR